jgi:predicted ATP-grasp superfamily ATP-dependent carboligase
MRILVTDGNERAALAVTRSLGRRGHEVTVVSATGRSLAGRSRFAHAERRVPSPLSDPAAFVDGVVHVAAEVRTEVLLPVGEAAALGVLGARERLQGVAVPFPALDAFRAVCDKERVLARARQLGIAVPSQHVAASREALAELASAALLFPLVAKPARSVAGAANEGLQKLRVRHVSDAATLRRLADELPAAAYPLMLQQRIVGPGTGIFVLPWNGALRAVFAHRRLREKPPSGGVSVYAESVAAEPELVERSRRLLDALGWQGVAMVEYKRDAATGVPYLMEINGRFWGSLQLAIDSGVDFPNLLLEAATGHALLAPPAFRTGQRLRWFWGDVDHLLMRLKGTARTLDLPPGSPGRARVVLDFLTAWRPGQRCEPWQLDDPAPFLHESAEWFSSAFGSRDPRP